MNSTRLTYTHTNETRIWIAAMFQQEARWLAEWVIYHQIIGITRFLLYDNCSTDDYLPELAPHLESGLVDVCDWRLPPGEDYDSVQCAAYQDALHRSLNATDWLAFIDIDEFIVPTVHDNLSGLLNGCDSTVGALRIAWVNFGTSSITRLPPKALAIEHFIRNSGPLFNLDFPVAEGTYKSIARPECVSKIIDPHNVALNSGYDYNNFPYSDAQVNHYWTKDEDFFNRVKIPRCASRGVTSKMCVDWAAQMNSNTDSHQAIQRFVPSLKAALRRHET